MWFFSRIVSILMSFGKHFSKLKTPSFLFFNNQLGTMFTNAFNADCDNAQYVFNWQPTLKPEAPAWKIENHITDLYNVNTSLYKVAMTVVHYQIKQLNLPSVNNLISILRNSGAVIPYNKIHNKEPVIKGGANKHSLNMSLRLHPSKSK